MGNKRSKNMVVATHNYTANEGVDLRFVKGDRLQVLDATEPDWWRVRHVNTGVESLIPSNFVAEEKSVESEDWWFGKMSRMEAEKRLLNEVNPPGTFLVRCSDHIGPHGFALSVKDWDESRAFHVKHYKIQPVDKGGYYIATSEPFPTLQALVQAYTKHARCLCHVLSRPCPKPAPQIWDLAPHLKDTWEIDRTMVQMTRKLGAGFFGEVWYGNCNGAEVAVKTMKTGTMSTKAFLQEAAIMKKFRHNRLVALYAVCSASEPILIVQEFMCNGSLLEFLVDGAGRQMALGDLVYVAAQVASGMEYLEKQQLVHRDVAARNVLIGESNMAKICDFGLARVIEENEYEYNAGQGCRFPIKWTPPEAFNERIFSVKSDVWSFGILLMELFTYGQQPYPGMNGREVMERVEKGYRMAKPTGHPIPDGIYTVMLSCWDKSREKRPSFAVLYRYFDDFSLINEGMCNEASA